MKDKLTELHKLLQRDFESCRKSRRDLFSLEKLRTDPDKRDWGFTLQWFEMDESILREFIDYICNWDITVWQKVSDDFLREFKDKFKWLNR